MKRREFLISLVGAMTAWPFTAPARASGTGYRLEPSLTAAQGSKIWRALREHDRSLRETIPAIRLYRYALVHDQVLIVDPGTKKIVSIIGQ
jgi:hypothetical protein